MKRMGLVLFLLVFCGVTEVVACRCVRRSPCEFYQQASAIFLGKNLGSKAQGDITFQVIEAFKNAPEKTIQMEVGGTFCGATAQPNEVVLVYAMKNEGGKLFARNCGFIRNSELNRGDLEYLRKRSKVEDARIFGGVYNSAESNLLPRWRATNEHYKKIRIRVSDSVSSYLLQLDAEHEFKIKDLPPGKYNVELLLPEDCVSDSKAVEVVELGERGCQEINFYFNLREEKTPKSRAKPKNKASH